MAKTAPTTKKANALVLLADQDVAKITPIEHLKEIAIRELLRLASSEQENSMRGIVLGMTLHKIKAIVPHGDFMPWVRDHLAGQSTQQGTIWTPRTAQKNANQFMRLAIVALEKTGATKPELLALPGDQTEFAIESADGAQRRFVDKLKKFVAGKSLAELLREHGIKGDAKLGGKREDDGEAPAAPVVLTPEQSAALAKDELSGWLEQGRDILLASNTAAALEAEDVRSFATGLEGLVAQWRRGMGSILNA